MTNELLPCPFCGSSARAYQDTNPDWAWYVMCDGGDCRTMGNRCKAEADAKTEWNKRADHIPEMDRLKMAFMEWLRVYEKLITMRWEWLSVTECDTLGEAQWVELVKEYELFTGKQQREETNE